MNVPAILTRMSMELLVVYYELTGDFYYVDVLRHQAAIGKDGILEHTRIDK